MKRVLCVGKLTKRSTVKKESVVTNCDNYISDLLEANINSPLPKIEIKDYDYSNLEIPSFLIKIQDERRNNRRR